MIAAAVDFPELLNLHNSGKCGDGCVYDSQDSCKARKRMAQPPYPDQPAWVHAMGDGVTWFMIAMIVISCIVGAVIEPPTNYLQR